MIVEIKTAEAAVITRGPFRKNILKNESEVSDGLL